VTPTAKQREYLDYIRSYVASHKRSPSEAEMVEFFQVTAPSVHRMIVTLSEKGFIRRQPGQARSIELVEEDAVAAEDEDDDFPTRPPDDIDAPLDPEIASLVHALRADPRILTKGSCWGHRKRPAYVDLAVDGLDGLHVFVERINAVDLGIEPEGIIDVALNFSQQVATACAFDIFPTWIMLSLSIEGPGRGGSPSAKLLERVAAIYTKAASSTRAPSRASKAYHNMSQAKPQLRP
jgi:hypothetical protein